MRSPRGWRGVVRRVPASRVPAESIPTRDAANFERARSRLYRSQILQKKTFETSRRDLHNALCTALMSPDCGRDMFDIFEKESISQRKSKTTEAVAN